MKKKTLEILKAALEGRYAVGAFNTYNMEITGGIVGAAHEENSPCIVQVTPSSIQYAGGKILGEMVGAFIEHGSNSTPIGFHLDHGKNFDDIMRAIDEGVDSVMIDCSLLDFKENIDVTSRVVKYAHEKGVSVQAELGKVPYLGREQQEVDWENVMTHPEEAKMMVEETGIDALAVGIGNAHGFFRERTEPDWARLEKIHALVPKTPLILHGASDWRGEKVKRAIERGVACFNIDTDIRVSFMTAICNRTSSGCDISDPRKVLGEAREAVKEKVKEKIRMFRGL